jgi:hypothetical protein
VKDRSTNAPPLTIDGQEVVLFERGPRSQTSQQH